MAHERIKAHLLCAGGSNKISKQAFHSIRHHLITIAPGTRFAAKISEKPVQQDAAYLATEVDLLAPEVADSIAKHLDHQSTTTNNQRGSQASGGNDDGTNPDGAGAGNPTLGLPPTLISSGIPITLVHSADLERARRSGATITATGAAEQAARMANSVPSRQHVTGGAMPAMANNNNNEPRRMMTTTPDHSTVMQVVEQESAQFVTSAIHHQFRRAQQTLRNHAEASMLQDAIAAEERIIALESQLHLLRLGRVRREAEPEREVLTTRAMIEEHDRYDRI